MKPENIFLLEDGQLKIGDFGTARVLDPEKQRKGNAGTMFYLPPEYFMNGRADFAADIWAVGCILCEVVRGRKVFEDEDKAKNSPPSLKSRILTQHPPPLPAHYSRHLRNTIHRMMRKNPKERPNARDLAENVLRYLVKDREELEEF